MFLGAAPKAAMHVNTICRLVALMTQVVRSAEPEGALVVICGGIADADPNRALLA